MYRNLDKYICDKVYRVESKYYGTFVGYMVNYYWGNIILITTKGVVHMKYTDIDTLIPIKAGEQLQKIIDDISFGSEEAEKIHDKIEKGKYAERQRERT